MNIYRRMVTALTASLVIVGLAGCDNPDEKSKTFTRMENGVGLVFTYHYVGDKVLRQEANNTIPYQTIGAANQEKAR